MANMGYCRFQNTLGDLQDCYDAMEQGEDQDLGEEEDRARPRIDRSLDAPQSRRRQSDRFRPRCGASNDL